MKRNTRRRIRYWYLTFQADDAVWSGLSCCEGDASDALSSLHKEPLLEGKKLALKYIKELTHREYNRLQAGTI